MIKVNLSDGNTLEFNLNKEDDIRQWLEWSSAQDFQSRITGIGVLHNKKFYTLPFPSNFRIVQFDAELVYSSKKGVKRQVGERVICHADKIRLELLVYTYNDPPPPVLSRVDMRNVGRQLFPTFKADQMRSNNV